MQTKLKKHIYAMLFVMMALLCVSSLFTSCKDENKVTGVQLLSFGPCPIARGAELKFIGLNLDKVTSIVLPGNIEITNFTAKTASLITLVVPQEAIEGLIVVKTPDGDITTKTPIGFSEPISISSFSPTNVKPGQNLTISGDYLSLVKQVIFTADAGGIVEEAKFVSKARDKIVLKVPFEAKTGQVTLSNGAAEPILYISPTALNITLPAITTMTPNPVVAGTDLTITGTDLDLVKQIIFTGKKYVDSVSFKNPHNATTFTVTVPTDAQTGKIGLITTSGVTVQSSADLTMTVPTVTNITPMTIKNSSTIAVTGTNLQLVTSVAFAGGGTGDMSGRTNTSMTVKVPASAITGIVNFNTSINVTVPGGTITIDPITITNVSPLTVLALQTITVTGNNLDNVAKVIFTGGVTVKPATQDNGTLTVVVPVGTLSGPITLESVNGIKVNSSQSLAFSKTLPSGFSFTEGAAVRGKLLTINGTNLSLIKTLVFPDNVIATDYVSKSDTKIEVYVPLATRPSNNDTISFVTQIGEKGIILPSIMVPSIEAVQDPTYVFFDFNGTGKDSWWGNAMGSGIVTDAAKSSDGTPFWNINGTCGTGWWDGLFFRNGANNLKLSGLDVSKGVVKFDVNIRQTISTGELRIRLGNFFYLYKPWATGGAFKTNGWETVTAPLNKFMDNYGGGSNSMSNADLQNAGTEFGMIWCSGTAITVNMAIDNVRFQVAP